MWKNLLVASCTTLLLAGSSLAGSAEDGQRPDETRMQGQTQPSAEDMNRQNDLGSDLGDSGSGATGDELPDRNQAPENEVAPYPYD